MNETVDGVIQFGKQKEGRDYYPRASVYAIAYDEKGKILVARARGKLVLPGGGIETGETAEQALHRELREETGWRVKIIGEACRANEYMISRRKGRATNKLARFFLVKAIEQVGPPTDDDHEPVWVSRKKALKKLRREFFRWAVERTEPGRS